MLLLKAEGPICHLEILLDAYSNLTLLTTVEILHLKQNASEEIKVAGPWTIL
jgi:hypothetical protein